MRNEDVTTRMIDRSLHPYYSILAILCSISIVEHGFLEIIAEYPSISGG